MPDAAVCGRCGRPREAFTLELPFGLGRRTWFRECACEAGRREAAARERRQHEHESKIRQLLRQAGIGLRHRGATFESFEVTPVTRPIVEVCREFVARFPENGSGLTLVGPAGTGKTHRAPASADGSTARGGNRLHLRLAHAE